MASVAEALSIALDHHDAGRMVEAETLYRRILAAVPEEANARHLLGVLCGQTGRAAAAEALIREAVVLAPAMADHHRNLAAVLEGARRWSDALPALRAARRLAPEDGSVAARLARALTVLADAALDDGDPGTAAGLYQEALPLRPDSVELRFNLAVAHRNSGRLAEAAEGFAAAARVRPDLALAHREQGEVERRLGRTQAAAGAFRRALALDPADADALYGLGIMPDRPEAAHALRRVIASRPDHDAAHAGVAVRHQTAGRTTQAIASYRRALALQPAMPAALINLCIALTSLGKVAEAARQGERAAALDPANADAFLAIGNALQAWRLNAGADTFYRMALARCPDFAAAHGNLGMALTGMGRPAEALGHVRIAIALQPDERTYHANLGLVLRNVGRLPQALASYRRALAIDPGWTETHSDLIFAMDFDPDATTAVLQAERRRFNERHGVPQRANRKPLRNTPDAGRRLRIGHVTADFRLNSAAFCFGPVLRLMDRGSFDIVCYSGVTVEDELTREFRGMATLWRNTVGMGDDALADLIRADGIDILVDMSGHSSGNRQSVFARRPAPVQITAWTHPHGIGLETMDYVFSDPVTIPAAERHLFMEAIWDLPCCLVFEPPAYAPAVAPQPALASGRLTFGSLNRLSKVTPTVMQRWARVLLACSGSELLLKDPALNDPAERVRIRAAFAGLGIAPERLHLLGGTSHVEHLAAYGQIDIALDPFPLSGGITTVEALWMGVPVVTMLGLSPPSRASSAIVSSLGLTDWVAADPDAYVELAVSKAADLPALAALRPTLRQRLRTSPVGDLALYTREVERAYRAIWRRWCAEASAG